ILQIVCVRTASVLKNPSQHPAPIHNQTNIQSFFSKCYHQPNSTIVMDVKNHSADADGPAADTSRPAGTSSKRQRPAAEMKENAPSHDYNLRQRGKATAGQNDVFERNYQYAFIYKAKHEKAVKEQEEAYASLPHFKAQPMPIGSPPRRFRMPQFTIPHTPEVLKHQNKKQAME
uniref:Uncharacterized protein n=1 Tax=Anopheles quadriannulatus TaxID=34691 RepID=A0A182WTP2_ANOQN